MTTEQRRVYESIVNGPRGTLVGPLRAALHRPELADKWQQLGELLRYRTSLPPHISEIAVLVTARRWNSQVEWHMHAIAAANAGIAADVIEDIKQHRRPVKAGAEALAVDDYAVELTETGTGTQATSDAARPPWKDGAADEPTTSSGHYSIL